MESSPRRIIFTGAPGAGKTALLRALEIMGLAVVEEAATDVIALAQAQGVDEPWRREGFVDKIVELQVLREERASTFAGAACLDRSPFCTLALARHLGVVPPKRLLQRLDQRREHVAYDKTVAFVASLDFITATPARRIGLDEAKRFGDLHREVYTQYGFELIDIPAGPLDQRLEQVISVFQLPTAHDQMRSPTAR